MFRFLISTVIILLGVDHYKPDLRDTVIDMLPEGQVATVLRDTFQNEDRSIAEVGLLWAQDKGTIAYGKLNEMAGGQTSSDIYNSMSDQLQSIGLEMPTEGAQ